MRPIHPEDPVNALMSTPVASIDAEASLLDVAVKLSDEGVGALVVMGERAPVGVISERDVVRALALGGEPTEVWAADVMADEPVWVKPDEPIITVAERMLDEGIRHVPVVANGELLGMVSARDALRVLTTMWREERQTRAVT